jgi:hypothetical protein
LSLIEIKCGEDDFHSVHNISNLVLLYICNLPISSSALAHLIEVMNPQIMETFQLENCSNIVDEAFANLTRLTNLKGFYCQGTSSGTFQTRFQC